MSENDVMATNDVSSTRWSLECLEGRLDRLDGGRGTDGRRHVVGRDARCRRHDVRVADDRLRYGIGWVLELGCDLLPCEVGEYLRGVAGVVQGVQADEVDEREPARR